MIPRACAVAYGDRGDGRCAWDGAVLPPGRRRWCSERCLRAWRANHVWADARAAAMLRDGERCRVCGDPEDLEVHHLTPVAVLGYAHGCQHHLAGLEVLCAPHHVEADMARRVAERGGALQLSLMLAA